MSDFSLTLVLQIKTSKIINDMAKVALIPQHFDLTSFISFLATKSSCLGQAAKPSAQDFVMSAFSLILVLQIKICIKPDRHGKGSNKI